MKKCDGRLPREPKNFICNNKAEWKVESCFGVTYHCNECKEYTEKNFWCPPIFDKLEKM